VIISYITGTNCCLRKLFAIFFLCIYLFNLAGYSTFFHVLIDRADSRMEDRLDGRQYRDDELVEIKLPLHLPYNSGSDEYYHVSGHIVADGKYYNYVKRKIASDTLYLYCISNTQANYLLNARNEYGKQANDLPSSQKETDAPGKKGGSVFQYQEPAPDFLITAIGIVLRTDHISPSSVLPSSCINTPYQPPEQLA
jgi:hypothetical protein